jgi:hypothetical protein
MKRFLVTAVSAFALTLAGCGNNANDANGTDTGAGTTGTGSETGTGGTMGGSGTGNTGGTMEGGMDQQNQMSDTMNNNPNE